MGATAGREEENKARL